MKILLAVDGSSHSERSAHHVISMVQSCEDHEIHLVNVQDVIDAPEIRSHMPEREIQAMQESRGGDALEAIRRLLEKAGMTYVPAVLIGPVAESIAKYAKDNACIQIVMGTRGVSGIGNVMLGSIPTRLLNLTDIPVTLVK